ncbi:hypothetical protein QQZ08_000230 [Neonectria magnoliae]|uniref:Xylanolytic transcriptional activator regulatory domain-containing protein n=1 Tax=Neonectria magnoliae TaxID=2732573 RepID=A0ABR1ILH3_9HYPO
MSSSRNFSSLVQDLLSPLQQDDQSKSSRTPESSHQKESTFNHAPMQIPCQDFPNLPSHQEAQRLLETAMFYIGHTQHHVDARDFSDRMWFFYANKDDPAQLGSPWCLEMMLVIAIGTLFDANPEGNGEFSGIELFEYVHKNVPTLTAMHSYGKLGVEIFGLFAIYLQNMHRREEAYLYISTALRLAISHKYHQVSGTKHLMKSEKVHLNRLWWTVYMQERRLAAATGNPSGIRDESIDVELPTNSPGFAPAGPLCINIKIARVTGRILSVLYGPEPHTEDTFVPNVQEIVKSLYDISQEIPSDSAKDFQGMGRDLCLRTTGSLHLMLYQSQQQKPAHFATWKTIKNLFRSGEKAIENSACEDGQKFSPSPGLPDALETMQYLADHGSKHALQRMKDLKGICKLMSHKIQSLQAMNNSPSTADVLAGNILNGLGSNERYGAASTPANPGNLNSEPSRDQVVSLENSVQGQPLRPDETPNGDIQLEPDLWDNFAHIWVPPTDGRGENLYQDVSMADVSPDEYYKCYFSMYNNADWSLTGEEMGGFAELGRQIQDV